MIKLKMLLKQMVMPGTKFKVLKKIEGRFGPNTYSQGIVKYIPVGSIIEYEGQLPNHNLWFLYNGERFVINFSSIQDLVFHNIIKLYE